MYTFYIVYVYIIYKEKISTWVGLEPVFNTKNLFIYKDVLIFFVDITDLSFKNFSRSHEYKF